MAFWESVLSGVIAGVSAAGVLSLAAWVWRSSRPTPDFILMRQAGVWMLFRAERSTAFNVQWSISDAQGFPVHFGGPQAVPPDIAFHEMELISSAMLPNFQLMVYWGARDRTNSQAVTIREGVAEYEVWAINRYPGRIRF